MKKAPNSLAKVLELFLKHCHRDHEGFDKGMEELTSKSFYAGAGNAILNIIDPDNAEVVEFISGSDGSPDDNLTCAYFSGMDAIPVLMTKVSKFDHAIRVKLFNSWREEATKGTAP